ncbi:Nn.00g019050.m01.CDS01 [Neocucurbitaria sp. VM-36]
MSSQAYSGYQPQQSSAQDSGAAVDSTARTVHYKCGDCDQDVPLKRGEPIRCRNCGHRVLYKQRTNR